MSRTEGTRTTFVSFGSFSKLSQQILKSSSNSMSMVPLLMMGWSLSTKGPHKTRRSGLLFPAASTSAFSGSKERSLTVVNGPEAMAIFLFLSSPPSLVEDTGFGIPVKTLRAVMQCPLGFNPSTAMTWPGKRLSESSLLVSILTRMLFECVDDPSSKMDASLILPSMDSLHTLPTTTTGSFEILYTELEAMMPYLSSRIFTSLFFLSSTSLSLLSGVSNINRASVAGPLSSFATPSFSSTTFL
mmetsp:Transcript_1976/g.3218  ORF Transcript_1976/g.3218 Transcript_1976/m.3218 type:complete len:243 (-) Transcript_1976:642-1370(-)